MLVYVLDKFPNLTETFILNEIDELRQKNIKFKICAVSLGQSCFEHSAIKNHLDIEYLCKDFLLKSILTQFYFVASFKSSYFVILFDILFKRRIPFFRKPNELKAFFISIYFLSRLKYLKIRHIHAHFINFPSTIALYMSLLSGISFSCTAHASDIYKGDISDIVYKIKKSKFIVTCTLSNKSYLSGLCSSFYHNKIFHIYHGINSNLWPMRNFTSVNVADFHVLAVARMVEKKGLKFLLEAIAILKDKGVGLRCFIVGDGPLMRDLQHLVSQKNLKNVVTFYGALPYWEVKKIYAISDFFVLPSVISADGDQDGLPNVLLEAMALGIPIITTPVSAIPELVINKFTGLLVDPNDPVGIANALLELRDNPLLCKMLVKNGRQLIKLNFCIERSIERLIHLFDID